MAVIGIDFGTEFSSVATILQDGHVDTLPDEQGKVRIASCVSFLNDEVRIGNLADLKREDNLKNTIYDLKLLMGQSYTTALALKKKYNWPFVIARGENDKVQVEVDYLGQVHPFYPEEIVSMLFHHLVEIAEKRIQPQRVSGAVITVSTSFNHAQRKSVLDAARIAKIEVKAILNETTAAAVRYAQVSPKCKESLQKILVIHVGAGSFAISVCHLSGSEVKVKYSDGCLLGGKDINMGIFNQIKQPTKDTPGLSRIGCANLHKVIEGVKKEFSMSDKKEIRIQIPSEDTTKESNVIIDRVHFDGACRQIQDSIFKTLKLVLASGQASCAQIDKVLLIGGSTRLLLVDNILKTFKLHEKLETASVKTDEMVVLGAGVLAYKNFFQQDKKHMIHVKDVVTYTIADNDKIEQVKKNTPIDRNLQKIACDFNSIVGGLPFQLLDQFSNVLISTRGTSRSTGVMIKLDDNGIISISGRDLPEIIDGLSAERISILVDRQHQLRESHVEKEVAEKERYRLEKEIFNAQKASKKMMKDCDNLADWFDNNPNCALATVRSKKQELNAILHPFAIIEKPNPVPKQPCDTSVCCEAMKCLPLKLQENELLQNQVFRLSNQLTSLENERRRLESMIESQCDKLSQQQIEFKQKTNTIKHSAMTKLDEVKQEMDSKLMEKSQIIKDLENKLANRKDIRTKEEFESLQNQEAMLKERNRNLQAKLDGYVCPNCEFSDRLRENAQSELNNARSKLQKLEKNRKDEILQKDKIIENLNETLRNRTGSKTKEEYQRLETEYGQMKQSLSESQEEARNLRIAMLSQKERHSKEIRYHGIEKDKLREKNRELQATLQAYTCTRCESLQSELKLVEKDNHKLEDQCSFLTDRLKKTEEENDNLRQQKAQLEDNRKKLLEENLELHDQVDAIQEELAEYKKGSSRAIVPNDKKKASGSEDKIKTSTKSALPGHAKRLSSRDGGMKESSRKEGSHIPVLDGGSSSRSTRFGTNSSRTGSTREKGFLSIFRSKK